MVCQRHLNYKKAEPDVRDYKLMSIPKLPPESKIDLRNRLPPIYNQGNLGSCTANAVGAMVNYMQKIKFMPSRLFTYYTTLTLENTVNEDAGATLRNTMKSVSRYGVCPETLWPYIISRFAIKPSDESYVAAASHKIIEYVSVPHDQSSIETLLSKNFVIAFGFIVYSSFYAVSRNGMARMPARGERVIGGHAVVLVGYDRSRRLFIVRNSWGSNWGDKGYFYMPYDYVLDRQRAFDFWVINAMV
jgi:C1A family cysteine protease